MLVCIPNVLDAGQLVSLRARLDRANDAWVDGRVTAGYQGAPVKFNQQIDEALGRGAGLPAHRRARRSRRNPLFISAVLPNVIYPPMFNRYGEGMKFGAHVDGSVRIHPHDGAQAAHRRVGDAVPHQSRRVRRRRARGRGHLRPSQRQAAGRRHGRLSRDQPAPGDADHPRRAHLVLLLGAEPDPRRDAARRALRDGRGHPAPQPDQRGRARRDDR